MHPWSEGRRITVLYRAKNVRQNWEDFPVGYWEGYDKFPALCTGLDNTLLSQEFWYWWSGLKNIYIVPGPQFKGIEENKLFCTKITYFDSKAFRESPKIKTFPRPWSHTFCSPVGRATIKDPRLPISQTITLILRLPSSSLKVQVRRAASH